MVKPDNPAGRLYLLLEEARSKSGGEPIRHVWADVLKVKRNDTKRLMLAMADLIQLLEETQNQVQRLPNVDLEIYLSPFEALAHLFDQHNFQAAWEKVRPLLDDRTMTALQFCSDALSKKSGEEILSADDLVELQKEVEDLIEKVATSEFDEEIKVILVERLDEVRNAILSYRISGISGLRRALERSVGAVLVNMEKLREANQAENSKETMKSFWHLISRIEKLTSVALKAKQLVTPLITNLLTSASS